MFCGLYLNRKLLEIKTEEKNMIGLYTDAAKIDFKTNYDDKGRKCFCYR